MKFVTAGFILLFSAVVGCEGFQQIHPPRRPCAVAGRPSSFAPAAKTAAPGGTEERASLLFVPVIADRELRADLAKNWGAITATGVLTALGGVFLLANPIFATGVAYDGLTALLAGYGVLGVVGLFAAEKGQKIKSLLFGLFNLYIAYTLTQVPVIGLYTITLYILASIGGEGLYHVGFAAANAELPGMVRLSYGLAGAASVAAAAYLFRGMPVTDLIVPGTALAANFISYGAGKVSIGLIGKQEADALEE